MSATQLYDAGFTEIIPIIPPDATLSEKSAIPEKNRGKSPGRRNSEGTWGGFDWIRAEPATRADAVKWDKWKANVGLLAANFPAIDIDVSSPALSAMVTELAHAMLGPAPVRSSVEPRALLPYRTDEPFGRMALIISHGGKAHVVEVLGAGRQYVVAGVHPSGETYGWDTGALRPHELTRIRREDASKFLDVLQQKLEAKGLECERVGSGAAPAAGAERADLAAPSDDDLAAIVAQIPNQCDRAGYIAMGYAIKAACDDEDRGREIFMEWADRWTEGTNDSDATANDFDSLKGPYRAGFSWLKEQAEAAGAFNSAQEDFTADVNAKPPVEKPRTERIPLDLTDMGIVEHITPSFSETLRYVAGDWYVYDTHRWVRDEELRRHERIVRSTLKRLAEVLYDRAITMPKEESGALLNARKRLRTKAGEDSVIAALKAPLAMKQDAFDVDHMLLNTPGGVVDLRSGAITATEPKHMLSRATKVAPRSGKTPLWNKFLHDSTAGDKDLIRFIQKMMGYSLTGSVVEKSLWFVWGGTETGKSTFIRIITNILGDYCDSVDSDVFMGSKFAANSTSLARLPGVRLVTATEPEAGHAWDEKRVKAITGGDAIEARFLYKQTFSYTPQFKILIIGNSEPEIKHVDDAMLRRLHIVPLDEKVAPEQRITDFDKQILESEAPAILAWMIEGCQLWLKEGLQPPAAVLYKTREYAREEDTLSQWIGEECEIAEDAECSRHDLYSAWRTWAKGRGEEPGGQKAFKRKMFPKRKEYGLTDAQVGERRLRGYKGIRLRSSVQDGTEFGVV